jgi:plastocyanin
MNPMKVAVIIPALLFAAGCASVADTTRTGTVHDVTFGERMTPSTLVVRPGDEIRWVNERTRPVTVEFLEGALDTVSCEDGFSRLGIGNPIGRIQESTTVRPQQSVSLCFANPGTVRYNARMEAGVAGDQIEQGTIEIR